MTNLRFTQEEKENILEALELVLQDIEKLWEKVKSTTPEISVYIFSYETTYGLGLDDKKLIINDQGIKLVDDRFIGQPSKETWLRKKEDLPKKRTLFQKKEKEPEIDLNLYYDFVRNYKSYTRQKLIETINKKIESKNKGLINIDDVSKEYSKTASIELMFQTQNQIPIEVTREEGQTIGILRFGNNTIKLVTNGEIILKDNNKAPQKKI